MGNWLIAAAINSPGHGNRLGFNVLMISYFVPFITFSYQKVGIEKILV